MEPTLIVFGIKSLVRFLNAGKKAMEQAARDQDAVFPELIKLDISKKNVVFSIFTQDKYKGEIANHKLDSGLIDRAKSNDALAIDTLFLLAVKIKQTESVDVNKWLGSRSARAGITIIKQWSREDEPVSPLAQIMLTTADITLEYVALDPKLLDGDESDKLLSAFAGNLSRFIVEGDFGKRNGLLGRLGAGFLRAGLETISSNPEWVSSEAHLQAFISATTKPILDAVPASLSDQLNYQQVLDTLSGPVFKIALDTIAQNQARFLGKDLDTSRALGALVQKVLLGFAKGDFKALSGRKAILNLYQVVLDLAVRQPKLFIENDGSAKDQAIEKLFVDLAQTLQVDAGQFSQDLAGQLAASVIASVAENLPGFADNDEVWSKTLVELTQTLLRNLNMAMQNNQNLRSRHLQLFSTQQWQDLARILLRNLAETPALVIGQREQFAGVVTAIAAAMAADKNLLLRGDHWLAIAEVAAREAAANPGRLFRLDPAKPEDMLAARLLSLLISAGAESLAAPDKSGAVLFGNTLQNAIEIALQASAGNLKGFADNISVLEGVVRELTLIVAKHSDQLGSKEWLRAFRVLLMDVLEGDVARPVTLEGVLKLLQGVS